MKPDLSFKVLLAAAAVAVVGGTSTRADYQSTVLADNPAGYWRFSETPVITPASLMATNLGNAGNVANGTYTGTYTRGVPGVLAGSTATYFTGGAWVQVANSPTLNPDVPFSVEFWIKPNPQAGTLTCPLSSTDFTPTPRLGWLFYTDDGYSGGYVNGGYYFRVYSSAGTKAIASPQGILTANWTHVVGVVDGVSVILYVNGQTAGTTPWSGSFTPNVEPGHRHWHALRRRLPPGWHDERSRHLPCGAYRQPGRGALSGCHDQRRGLSGPSPRFESCWLLAVE